MNFDIVEHGPLGGPGALTAGSGLGRTPWTLGPTVTAAAEAESGSQPARMPQCHDDDSSKFSSGYRLEV